MERIDSNISSAVNFPVNLEKDRSSTVITVSGAESAFGSEANETVPKVWFRPLLQRVSKRIRVEYEKIVGDEQVRNYLEKISSAMKEKNWSTLDELLQSAIDSDMSVNQLKFFIKRIKKIDSRSKDNPRKIGNGNNLNGVFMFAVTYGQTALVKVLLKLGFDATCNSVRNEEGMYPLHYTAQLGNIKIAELLLSNGSDINLEKFNPLQIAISNNHLDMVKFLLINRADANIGSGIWGLPLSLSIRINDVDIFMCLLNSSNADLNIHREGCASPLAAAVINNRVKFVELLLERKADINELFKGESMLERALKSNNVHISACLVLAGATLDSTDLDRYNGLLSLNGYDQYEGTLSLNALVCRKINPHFHRCKSIEEIDALASKINLPPGLISPFYKGLESGTAKEELDGNLVDPSAVFYRSGSRFLDYHDLRKIEEKKKIEDMKIENNEACK